MSKRLPRILVIDDLFGREVAGGINRERENLCAKMLLAPVSIDGKPVAQQLQVKQPIATAVFARGQSPARADIGDEVANDPAATLQLVARGWTDAIEAGETPWALILLDLCFYTGLVTAESNAVAPGMPVGNPDDDNPKAYFGLRLLEAIHRRYPDVPVVILSSKARADVSLEFSRHGAAGFIARDDERAGDLLRQALWSNGLMEDPAGILVGRSLPLLAVLREARRAAGHTQNLLVRGERGTGKELIVDFIHRARAGAPGKASKSLPPLIKVNSGLLSSGVFTADLFGVEAKTSGGSDGRAGLIETAHGGDLFLDEISDLTADAQAALLRVLQDRTVTRVGGRQAKNVDVRFLSATNTAVEDGARLRGDLLDRLREGGTLWAPPLRERLSDVPQLVERFVQDAEDATPNAMGREVTPEALNQLLSYSWPGNVRELRSCIFAAVTRNPDVEYLVAAHLDVPKPQRGGAGAPPPAGLTAPGQVVSANEAMSFGDDNVDAWAGTLHELSASHHMMMARLLEAALRVTKRRTAAKPEGEIQIHPAVKLATGESDISASSAADLIKRTLTPIENTLSGDLSVAYRIALRLRPRSRKDGAP